MMNKKSVDKMILEEKAQYAFKNYNIENITDNNKDFFKGSPLLQKYKENSNASNTKSNHFTVDQNTFNDLDYIVKLNSKINERVLEKFLKREDGDFVLQNGEGKILKTTNNKDIKDTDNNDNYSTLFNTEVEDIRTVDKENLN